MVVRCIFCLCSLCLSLSLSVSFSLSKFLHLSHSPRLRSWRCWRPSQPAEQRLLNVLRKPKQNSSHGSEPSMNSPDLVVIIETEAAPSFEEELQEEEEDGALVGVGDRNWERESTQDIKNDAHPDSRSCKPRHRSSNENPHRVRKMTTHRKGFVQCCKKPRTSQQCQRPACHVHLRGACGRDVGDVEEGIESGRTLSPESEILLPLLVEMPKSRANRIFSSEQDTGIGAVSSALIRGFPVKTAASSAASVSSRPSSSSSSCPASAVCSSSPPSTCEFAILARISTSATTSILTFRN